jgi:hypothetical protein
MVMILFCFEKIKEKAKEERAHQEQNRKQSKAGYFQALAQEAAG